MNSELIIKEYPNGDRQRIHLVRADSWSELDFIYPEWSPESFEKICTLYRDFIVPRCPWIFGQLILFRLPEDLETGLCRDFSKYGYVSDRLTAAAITLRKGVVIVGGSPQFLSRSSRMLWKELERKGCVRIVRGNLPNTTVLPVNRNLGFLSDCCPDARLKVNSSFFIMDRFDCSTAYDSIGTPVGMYVKDGKVFNPPLFEREAILAGERGSVEISVPCIRDLGVVVGNIVFRHGDNASFYSRPESRKTPPSGKTELVIIGNKIAAVKRGGRTMVPSSGFVLSIEDGSSGFIPGQSVEYIGFESTAFGIQVGNSITVSGKKTGGFISPFYNIKKLWSTSYPPSLYPLDFENARAPRIALGADNCGKPMILWAEGAAKFGYRSGDFSCGASLSEMADICSELGMVNAVNLDGGGSAQILIDNRRMLNISDRNRDNLSEAERAVPVGIFIR